MNSNKDSRGRAVVIGLDGTPFSFLEEEIKAGSLPNIGRLASRGKLARMTSEMPTVSSVAWASFMTGKNPAEHGIFGFTDRKSGTYDLYFPNYSNLKAEPFWDRLSREDKRCCIVNVPSTYPARPLNGVLVSGFVAPNLERATYPSETYEALKAMGYRIDVDASKARESLDSLLEDLHLTLEKRREALFYFWKQEQWDLFVFVFTGTDRLHHFMWKHYEEGDITYKKEFINYYKRIDEILGEFENELPDEIPLFMLSDHGFCQINKEVYLNHFLAQWGDLAFSGSDPKTISDIDPSRTKVYCMDPGRIYLNMSGREPAGIISADRYDDILESVASKIMEIEDPDSGDKVVDAVYRGKELYSGGLLSLGPDLVVMPKRGYDIKGFMGRETGFGNSHMTGMHTYDDAFMFASRGEEDVVDSIRNMADVILQYV